MKMTCDNDCTRAGWIEAIAESSEHVLHVSFDPRDDTEGTFAAFCHDDQEMLWVHGWNFVIYTDRETVERGNGLQPGPWDIADGVTS